MLRIFKRVLMFTMAFVSVIPAVPCKKEPKKEKSSKTLAEKICEEAQKVADFARDQKFTYGNASINPGHNWGALDVEKAINPDERLSSCDRFVDWVLYRCGFVDQPYDNGYDVPKVYAWFDAMEFEKITDVSALQTGDIVFTKEDPLKPGYPGHVFICASENLGDNVYLRYDHGSTERIKCVKGTEVTAGQQPFKEVIDEFYFAYRPDDKRL